MTLSIGLTGGIGSGKSTVTALFAKLGAAIIDTDVISHALTAPGGAAMAPIAAHFGATMIQPDGSLNRARMRELVFSDPRARQQLEQILHPMIRAAAEEQAQALASSAPYLIFVVPLLVESGEWAQRVDRVLLVDCDEDTQLARVMQRSGLGATQISAAQAQAMLAAQASRSTRRAHADDVIDNHGDRAALDAQVARLDALYRQLALTLTPPHLEIKK